MRKPYFFLLLLAYFCSLNVMAQTFKLVWADEFDSNSTTTNWTKVQNEKPSNNELQYYTTSESNVRVENGNLVITGIRETKGSKSFTSGRVNSKGKVYFKLGVVAARIKFPKTKGGLWPAFWLMGIEYGWPRCGEIDVVELGRGITTGKEERYFSAAVHWGENSEQHAQFDHYTTNPYSVQDDYHLWICDWNENEMRCFLDNQTEPYAKFYIGQGSEPFNYVHRYSYILLNLAIGGNYPKITDPAGITALPQEGSKAEMLVDWVRIYQREGQENVLCGENDMNKVAEEERTLTLPQSAEFPEIERPIIPAPKHAYSSSNVSALFSNQYSCRGVGSFFDTLGSANEQLMYYNIAPDDKVEEVRNFRIVGFNFNADYSAIPMTTMAYLHCDIYTMRDMDIGITPITKGPEEYKQKYFHLKANQWNSVDINLNDFKVANPAMNFSKAFQIKWFGGDGKSTIWIDNIFFFRGVPTGCTLPWADNHAAQVSYDLQGISLKKSVTNHGIYIVNKKKWIKLTK